MEKLLLGLLAAFAASVLYNLGLAVQALDARLVPTEHGLSPTLITKLIRRRRWLAGSLLVALGWPLQAGALLLAPLTLVQPALAIGLLLLLAIGSRMLGERVGVRERAAVLAIVGGVTVLALVAPHRDATASSGSAMTIALVILGALALAPYAIAPFYRVGGRTIAIACGLAYSWGAISTKLATDALSTGDWGLCIAWVLATAITGIVGLLSEMTALQRRGATQVGPLVFVVQTLVPVALAWPLLGEAWSSTPGSGIPIVCATLTIAVAAAVLASSPAVIGLTADQPSAEGEVPASPRSSSADSSRSSTAESSDATDSRSTTTTAPL
jgi:drug/metabolite transporter (DMT)-like permease